LYNFFRSHVRNFATISTPLNRLTYKEANWKGGILTPNCLEAFNSLKQSLISEPIVDYPRKHRPYSLIVDASTGTGEINGELGAILCQTVKDGEERGITYPSRQLLKLEKNYTSLLVEMQAMVWAMDHFDTYLRGRQLPVFTDHKLLHTQSKRQDKTMNRLTEDFLKYNFLIKYKKGSEMLADFLCQNAIDAVGIFSHQWKLEQERNEFCSSIKQHMHRYKTMCSCKHLEIANSCFMDDGILWRKIQRHGKQKKQSL
jgi:hypothetical protein